MQMSEYLHVEKPFLDQLAALGWKITNQGQGLIPSDPAKSLRTSFRKWILPEVFHETVRSIDLTPDGTGWLTNRQLDDLRNQVFSDEVSRAAL
jgi:type I restriction enzyme R subunit